MNYGVSINNTQATLQGTKIVQWTRSAEKILFTEEIDPDDGCYSPPTDRLTTRHGSGYKEMNPVSGYAVGSACGINVNAAFFDGHAEPITQDYADDSTRYLQNTP